MKLTGQLVLLVFCCTTIMYAQKPHFERENSRLNIRGKALSSIFVEDYIISSVTLGAEYHFLKNHSIGVDGFLISERHEHDLYDEETDDYDVSGSHQYILRRTLLVDHRYYWYSEEKLQAGKFWSLYLSNYLRFSDKKLRTDDDYAELVLGEGDKVRNNVDILDIGTSVGTRFFLGADFGIDFEVGCSYRQQKQNFTLLVTDTETTKITNYKTNGFLPAVRLNLFLYFSHLSAKGSATKAKYKKEKKARKEKKRKDRKLEREVKKGKNVTANTINW